MLDDASRSAGEAEDAVKEELWAAQQRFDGACQTSLTTDEGLSCLQFALLLLAPQNDAVAPPPLIDLSQPLSHYWAATSHNSYCIGDQLTGVSSAAAYRRQLLQGCRCLEVDCW